MAPDLFEILDAIRDVRGMIDEAQTMLRRERAELLDKAHDKIRREVTIEVLTFNGSLDQKRALTKAYTEVTNQLLAAKSQQKGA